MKQGISPAVAVVVILIVVVVVAAVGYFLFMKPKPGDGGPEEGEMGFEAMEQDMNDPAVKKLQQEQKGGAGDAGKYGFK